MAAAVVVALILLALAYAGTRGDVRRSKVGRRIEDAAPVAWQYVGLRSGSPAARLEAARRLSLLRGKRIAGVIPGLLADPNPTMRRHAVRLAAWARDPRVVRDLLPMLRSRAAADRRDAADALGEIGDRRAISALQPLLSDGNPYVRGAAARALGKLGDQTSGEAIVKLLGDKWPAAEGAVEGLGALRYEPAVPALARLLDPRSALESKAAEALGTIGGPKAGHALYRALVRTGSSPALWVLTEDGDRCRSTLIAGLRLSADPFLRWEFAQRLGRLRERAAVPELLRRLADEDAGVAAASATALGRIGDRRAAGPLLAMLRDTTAEGYVRAAAAGALGELKAPEAMPAVRAAMDDGDAKLAAAAAEGYGALGGARVAPELQGLLRKASAARRPGLLRGLGRTGDPTVAPTLIAALSGAPESARAAAEGLGRLGTPQGAAALRAALGTEGLDHSVREIAARHLAEAQPPGARDALYRVAMTSPNWAMRDECVWLLAELGDRRIVDIHTTGPDAMAFGSMERDPPAYLEPYLLRLGTTRAGLALCRERWYWPWEIEGLEEEMEFSAGLTDVYGQE